MSDELRDFVQRAQSAQKAVDEILSPPVDDDPAIALIKAQANDVRGFMSELRSTAHRMGINGQVATKLETILGHRVWGHYNTAYGARAPEPPRTLAQLLEPQHRRSIARGSKSWALLRAWLEDRGFKNIDESDGRPRCAHCGALVRRGLEPR